MTHHLSRCTEGRCQTIGNVQAGWWYTQFPGYGIEVITLSYRPIIDQKVSSANCLLCFAGQQDASCYVPDVDQWQVIVARADDRHLVLLHQSGKAGEAVRIARPINQARPYNGHGCTPVLDELLDEALACNLAAAIGVLLAAVRCCLVNPVTDDKAMYVYRTDMYESLDTCC